MDNVKLKEFVQQGISSLSREQAEKDYRTTLAEDVKEVLDMGKAEFNAICKAAYDLHKAKEELEKKEDIIASAESLGYM